MKDPQENSQSKGTDTSKEQLQRKQQVEAAKKQIELSEKQLEAQRKLIQTEIDSRNKTLEEMEKANQGGTFEDKKKTAKRALLEATGFGQAALAFENMTGIAASYEEKKAKEKEEAKNKIDEEKSKHESELASLEEKHQKEVQWIKTEQGIKDDGSVESGFSNSVNVAGISADVLKVENEESDTTASSMIVGKEEPKVDKDQMKEELIQAEKDRMIQEETLTVLKSIDETLKDGIAVPMVEEEKEKKEGLFGGIITMLVTFFKDKLLGPILKPFKALGGAIKGFGGKVLGTVLKPFKAVGGAVTKMFGGVTSKIGGMFKGVTGKISGMFGNMISKVGGRLGKLGGPILKMFKGVGGKLGGLLSSVGGKAGGLAGKAGGAVAGAASKVAGGAAGMLGKAGGMLGKGLKFLGPIGAAAGAILGAANGVANASEIFGKEQTTLGEDISAGIGGLAESLTFGLVDMESAAKFVHGAGQAIADGFTAVTDTVGDAAGWVGDKLSAGASWIGDKMSEGASMVGEGLSAGASWLGDKLSAGATAYMDHLSGGASFLGEKLGQGADALLGVFGTSTDALGEKLSSATDWLGEKFTAGADGFLSMFGTSLDGIGQGVSDMASGLNDWASDLLGFDVGEKIGGAVDSVKSFFGFGGDEATPETEQSETAGGAKAATGGDKPKESKEEKWLNIGQGSMSDLIPIPGENAWVSYQYGKHDKFKWQPKDIEKFGKDILSGKTVSTGRDFIPQDIEHVNEFNPSAGAIIESLSGSKGGGATMTASSIEPASASNKVTNAQVDKGSFKETNSVRVKEAQHRANEKREAKRKEELSQINSKPVVVQSGGGGGSVPSAGKTKDRVDDSDLMLLSGTFLSDF